MTSVRFWVDPACPWCWVTAGWINDIAPERDLAITWEPISLLRKNNTDPESEFYPRVAWTLGLLRVMESVRPTVSAAKLGELYFEFGRRIHHNQDRLWDAAEALEAVGIDVSHAAAANDTSWDAEVNRRMDEGLALVGTDVGTPIISFLDDDGAEVAAFGPVIVDIPERSRGVKLWDAFVAVTAMEEFSEIKRTRTRGPVFEPRGPGESPAIHAG